MRKRRATWAWVQEQMRLRQELEEGNTREIDFVEGGEEEDVEEGDGYFTENDLVEGNQMRMAVLI